MNRLLVLLCIIPLLLAKGEINAQSRYFAEIGILGGGTFYLGDASSVPFTNLNAAYGGFLKYKLNERYAFGLQATGGKVNIPAFESIKAHTTSIADVEALAEFHFFDYGLGRKHSQTKRATPYIFAGVGCVIYEQNAAFTIPFGVGAKFKLSERTNLGITWSIKKIFKDDFDQIDNPRALNKSVFINNDWYSSFTLAFSVDFWQFCRTCYSGLRK